MQFISIHLSFRERDILEQLMQEISVKEEHATDNYKVRGDVYACYINLFFIQTEHYFRADNTMNMWQA